MDDDFSDISTNALRAQLFDLVAIGEDYDAWVHWLQQEGGRAQFDAQWGSDAGEIFAYRLANVLAAKHEAEAIMAELQRRAPSAASMPRQPGAPGTPTRWPGLVPGPAPAASA